MTSHLSKIFLMLFIGWSLETAAQMTPPTTPYEPPPTANPSAPPINPIGPNVNSGHLRNSNTNGAIVRSAKGPRKSSDRANAVPAHEAGTHKGLEGTGTAAGSTIPPVPTR